MIQVEVNVVLAHTATGETNRVFEGMGRVCENAKGRVGTLSVVVLTQRILEVEGYKGTLEKVVLPCFHPIER